MASLNSILYFLDNNTPNVIRNIAGAINKALYRGTKYHCPLCFSNLRLFHPLPQRFRVNLKIKNDVYTVYDYETLNVDNYLCPVCRCSDRDRLYALYIRSLSAEASRTKVLIHFAPERSLSRYLRKCNYNYRTADLYMKDVDDRLDITKMDTYEANSIDCFICSHILEHVEDDRGAISELFRIVKLGGWGILMAPLVPRLDATYEDPSKTSKQERRDCFGQDDHIRVYARKDFMYKVENAGFRIRQLGVDYFGEEVFEKCGITKKSVLYVVYKEF